MAPLDDIQPKMEQEIGGATQFKFIISCNISMRKRDIDIALT